MLSVVNVVAIVWVNSKCKDKSRLINSTCSRDAPGLVEIVIIPWNANGKAKSFDVSIKNYLLYVSLGGRHPGAALERGEYN